MKYTKLLIGIILTLCYNTIGAQTYEDAIRFSQQQFLGTARSISMGGAFGSLGGDFTAIGINPAGIAVYRSSEFTFTPSLNINSTESSFNGLSMDENQTRIGFSQIGFVGTYKPMREVKEGIVSSHFAIGYNKNNNFNFKSIASGNGIVNSMTDIFRINAYGLNPDYYEDSYPDYWDPYNANTGLAFGTYLIDLDGLDDDNVQTYSSFLNEGDKVDQTRVIEKIGYSGEINITGGINISHILMLGGSFNIHTLSYEHDSYYYEQFNAENPENSITFNNFTLHEYLNMSGTGVSLKIGAIVKPIQNLRIGLAYHSPAWIKIEEDYGAKLTVDFFNNIPEIGTRFTEKRYDSQYDYQINTPSKMIGSLSYIFGKKGLISFDYERIDYSNAKIKSNNNSLGDITFATNQSDIISETYTAVNNIRIGGEFRASQNLSIRAGYGIIGSPLENDSENLKITNLSGGIGYRNSSYFIDLAYQLSSSKDYYYNYDWDTIHDVNLQAPPRTSLDIKNHYLALTLGFKF